MRLGRHLSVVAAVLAVAFGCGEDDGSVMPGMDGGGPMVDGGSPEVDGGPPGVDSGPITPIVCTDQCRYVREGAPSGASGLDWADAYGDLPDDLERGAVYWVAAGAYGGHDFADDVDGTLVIAVVKATTADHGTDTGWMDAYGDGVAELGPVTFKRSYYVLDGRTGGGRGAWRTGHGFHIDVSSGGYAITVGDPFGSMEEREQDRSNITVRHVEVSGTRVPCNDIGGGGVSLGSGLDGHMNITLSHLWIHDLGIPMQGALLRGALVEQSVFERNASSASCHSEGWAAWGPSDHVVVRDNIFADLEGTAFIAIGNAYRWDVYDNLFMCTPGGPTCGVGNGVIGTTDHDYETTSDWRLHHNVVAGVADGSAAFDSRFPRRPARDEQRRLQQHLLRQQNEHLVLRHRSRLRPLLR